MQVSGISDTTIRSNLNFRGQLLRESPNKVLSEIKLIEDTIYELAQDPNINITIALISEKTGLSYTTVSNRIHNKAAKNLYELWFKIHDTRQIDSDCSEYSGSDIIYAINTKKISQKTKAFKLMKQALEDNRKISYQSLEKQTGLTRQEIDDVIQDYINYQHKKSEQKIKNKQIQLNWNNNASV